MCHYIKALSVSHNVLMNPPISNCTIILKPQLLYSGAINTLALPTYELPFYLRIVCQVLHLPRKHSFMNVWIINIYEYIFHHNFSFSKTSICNKSKPDSPLFTSKPRQFLECYLSSYLVDTMTILSPFLFL